jgi:acyl-CoA thioesterase I
MRSLVTLSLLAAMTTACADPVVATTGPSVALPPRTIVALGDSLTSGKGLSAELAYPAVLQRMIDETRLPFRVINHGLSGDTTRGGVRRLDAALAGRPAVMIVALGANDGLRGVPVADVRSNLEEIIRAAKAENVKVLLCGMEAPPFHGLDYTVQFHQIYPALAGRHAIPLVPFMLQNVLVNGIDMLQADLHPNAAGAAEIARTIWPYLHPLLVAADSAALGV